MQSALVDGVGGGGRAYSGGSMALRLRHKVRNAMRRLQQGWPIRRLRAELRVDQAWLMQQLARPDIPRS